MKKILAAASAAFFVVCAPASAQWQTPNHSVPVGKGTGLGFNNATPASTNGVPLVSNGAASDPGFGTAAVAGGGTGVTSIAAHAVVIGNGTGAIVAVAPSATVGVALVSNGSSADPSFSALNLGASGAVTGTLAAANGGTGFASYTVGDLLYANTTTTLAKLADVATGNALLSGGVGVAPAWGKVTPSHFSGVLPVPNGGTGTDGALVVVTGSSATVTAGTGALAVNRTAPATTTIALPPVSTQALVTLHIFDWSQSVTEHTITITPDGSEKIMRLSSWSLVSTTDSLASVTLYPAPDLSGWYIAP